jgi:NitT/TauT family transport system substrate-binding protein
MNARIFRIAAAALIAAFALAPAGSNAQQITTLRILASPVDDVMPVLYAQKAGLFQKAGLNVVLTVASSGAAASTAVAGGAAEMGKGNITSIIVAHAHNVPLVIVAPAAIYDPKTPDGVLVTASGSPIKTARDLEGKIVGVPSLSDLSLAAVEGWMESQGADYKKTQFVETPLPTMLPALEANRVQAVTLIKPFIDDAVASGKGQVLGLMYNAIAPRFLESAWFANADYVAAHKDVIAAFQRVVAQASVYTNAHHSETVDMLASFTGITPERASKVARIVTGTTLVAADIQPVIASAAKYGLISKAFDAQEIMAR